MKIGVIGLGRMGGNISLRLMKHGHECVVYDNSEKAVDGIVGQGAAKSTGLQDMVQPARLAQIVWVMLPAGKITEDTVHALGGMMGKGDIIIDGGNSMYKDDIRRAADAARKGHRLRRRRHVRRRVGPGARLLHDDRRRGRGGEAHRPDPVRAGARRGHYRQDAGPRGPQPDGRAGLSALRPGRRRPFRQDGP